MLPRLELLLAGLLLVGLYLLATGQLENLGLRLFSKPESVGAENAGAENAGAENAGPSAESAASVPTAEEVQPSSGELNTRQMAEIYGNDRSMIQRIHQGPQDHFGNLDGNLGEGGIYHDVAYGNRFICQGCQNCAPASYQNDVDERFMNPALHTQLRKVRTDEYPQYQLN